MFHYGKEESFLIQLIIINFVSFNQISLELHFLKAKKISIILFSLLVLIFISEKMNGIGLKIVTPYNQGLLPEVMPWEIKEAEGWLFIASDDGLVQFDGSFPELFQFNNRRPVRSVSFNPIDKKIYAGGISEFGYFQPSMLQSLEYVCLSDSMGDERHIGNIWGIYPYNDNLIVHGDNAVINYNLSNGKYNIIYSDSKLDVSSLINGVLWLGTESGLKVLVGHSFVEVPNSENISGKRIRKILPYGEEKIIVTSDGLWIYSNQKLTRLSQYEGFIERLGEIFTASIKDNFLVLGSVSHGVGLLDLDTGETSIYDESNGLPSNTVISLTFDSSGDLWAGLQYGLAKINLDQPVESIDNTQYPIGSGYVLALKDNQLYMGTNRGLFRGDFDKSENRLVSDVERISGLRGQVWGLSQIDGSLFVCHDHGLYEIISGGEYRKIGDFSGIWDVQKLVGSSNSALVGSYNGLHILKKRGGVWNYSSNINGYPSSVYNFAQESPLVVWSENAEEGIDRIVIDTLNNTVREIRNFQKTEDGFPLTADIYLCKIDNTVFFATKNGIYYWDSKSGKILKDKEISRLLGYPKDVRRLKKANGGLFALTDNELLNADPAGILDLKRLSLSPSLTRQIYEGELFFPVGSDYLGYPTKTGYLFFDLSQNSDSLWHDVSPSVAITNVLVSNKGDSVIYKGNIGKLKYEPVLKFDENSLRIIFGRIEDAERGVMYSTRVNQGSWSAASPLIMKELTGLREGKYQFEVKAISPAGQTAFDSFTFRITPPWWRTKWMYALYAIIFLSSVIVLIRIVQIRIGEKQKRLLAEKDLQISRQNEMHQKETEEKDRQIQQLEKEQIEKELKHKAQEMANVMMSLSHKNETLQTVKKDLHSILKYIPQGNTEARKAITQLQEKVVVDIKSDDVLKRVADEFDIVHDNFMKKLRERYPDLSNNEILLCAYLKMNLSTKEIAPMLNISLRGVETMRYRLRKKLGLEREDSLTTFISNFA